MELQRCCHLNKKAMAEIIQSSNKRKAGVSKLNKASLKVDLTPMVDLGFLLISFFVFTTTLSQPKALGLKIPDDKNIKEPSKAPVSKTLNLVLGANDKIYSYDGDELKSLKVTGTQSNQLRSVIMQKKQTLIERFKTDTDIVVLIKPTIDASYKDVVNTLNEMLICNIKTYVLMDATNIEMQATKQVKVRIF